MIQGLSAATDESDAFSGRAAPSGRLAEIAPRAASLEATGLSVELLGDLTSKILLRTGSLACSALSARLGLPGSVATEVLQSLRRHGRVEVTPSASSAEPRYGLSQRGREAARSALERDAYAGPAPVTLEDYTRIVSAQSARTRRVDRSVMERAFKGVVINDDLRDQIGTALNSGRPMMLHGPAGCGKTYLTRRLDWTLPGEVLVPHAVLVNGTAVRVFDPLLYNNIDMIDGNAPMRLSAGFDNRYVCCDRPVVRAGSELELSMLEVGRDAATNELQAPLQMRANNGLLIIDDVGRQRGAPQQVLHRLLVPIEDARDQLSAAGTHFSVPLDVMLVFATNLELTSIADPALLRHIGYKIAVRPISADHYREIWQQTCSVLKLPCDRALLDFVISELYPRHGEPLLPCHPHALLSMLVDRRQYEGGYVVMDQALVTWAWNTYFASSR